METESAGTSDIKIGFTIPASPIAVILVVGLLVRLIAAALPGFGIDLGTFQFWSVRLGDQGPWNFYSDDGSLNKGIWTGGVAGDLPVPADYDGDGTDDIVVWRSGAWLFFDFATGNFLPGSSVWTGAPPHWTGGTTVPAPMDYDGDGTADFMVWSGGPWHFFNDDGSYSKGIWTGVVPGDLAVPADYDGDGTEDVVVWREGAWLEFDYATGSYIGGVWTGAPPHWTGGTTLPAPLDYDGDGDVDYTVFAGGPWHFYNEDGSYYKGIWTGGVAGDQGLSRRLLP